MLDEDAGEGALANVAKKESRALKGFSFSNFSNPSMLRGLVVGFAAFASPTSFSVNKRHNQRLPLRMSLNAPKALLKALMIKPRRVIKAFKLHKLTLISLKKRM